jgi:hypothetical protein
MELAARWATRSAQAGDQVGPLRHTGWKRFSTALIITSLAGLEVAFPQQPGWVLKRFTPMWFAGFAAAISPAAPELNRAVSSLCSRHWPCPGGYNAARARDSQRLRDASSAPQVRLGREASRVEIVGSFNA